MHSLPDRIFKTTAPALSMTPLATQAPGVKVHTNPVAIFFKAFFGLAVESKELSKMYGTPVYVNLASLKKFQEGYLPRALDTDAQRINFVKLMVAHMRDPESESIPKARFDRCIEDAKTDLASLPTGTQPGGVFPPVGPRLGAAPLSRRVLLTTTGAFITWKNRNRHFDDDQRNLLETRFLECFCRGKSVIEAKSQFLSWFTSVQQQLFPDTPVEFMASMLEGMNSDSSQEERIKAVLSTGNLSFHSETTNPLTAFLGNVQPVRVEYNGLTYTCAEAAYQAQKFRPELRAQFQGLTGYQAKVRAQELATRRLQRSDWKAVSLDVMRGVLHAKFDQNPELRKLLLATGTSYLFEATTDAFWSCGKDGRGQNKLGQLLMELRGQLGGIGVVTKSEVPSPPPPSAALLPPPLLAGRRAVDPSGPIAVPPHAPLVSPRPMAPALHEHGAAPLPPPLSEGRGASGPSVLLPVRPRSHDPLVASAISTAVQSVASTIFDTIEVIKKGVIAKSLKWIKKEGELGRGGFKVVERISTQSVTPGKLPKAYAFASYKGTDESDASVRGLQAECAISEKLHDLGVPNIVKMRVATHINVHTGEKERGALMELCDGGSLRSQDHASPPEKIRLALEVTEAIAGMHKHGIYHMDLKLDNVFLKTGKDGRVHARVGDFGLSQESPADATKSADFRDRDLFLLGVMLFELKTGFSILRDAHLDMRYDEPIPEDAQRSIYQYIHEQSSLASTDDPLNECILKLVNPDRASKCSAQEVCDILKRAMPAAPVAPGVVPSEPLGTPVVSPPPVAPPAAEPAHVAQISSIARTGQVCFYKTGPTEFLGNFAPCPHGISVFGKRFQCAEAAFQWKKYDTILREHPEIVPPLRTQIIILMEELTTCTGQRAFEINQQLGGVKSGSPRGLIPGVFAQNWQKGERNVVMWSVLQAKFQQNPEMKQLLDATKGSYLLEHNNRTGKDDYWSDNHDGSGQNILGKMIMALRDSTPRLNSDRVPAASFTYPIF